MKKQLQQVVVAIIVATVATNCASSHGNDGEDPGPGIVGLAAGKIEEATFNGKVRKTAKTTMISPKLTVSFDTIRKVVCNDLLLPECAIVPKVTKWTKATDRTGDEERLGKFDGWIYAWNVPDDGDFHVLVGDQATFSTTMNLINIEISALPYDNSKALQPQDQQRNDQFKAVRLKFMKKVGPGAKFSTAYVCIKSPIKVTVWGGPFWDYQHATKPPGTTTCRDPKTGQKMDLIMKNAWEIHPVTDIQ